MAENQPPYLPVPAVPPLAAAANVEIPPAVLQPQDVNAQVLEGRLHYLGKLMDLSSTISAIPADVLWL